MNWQLLSTLIILLVIIKKVRTDIILGVTLSKLNRDVEGIEFFDDALKIINSKPQIDKVAKLNSLRYKGNIMN